MKAFVFIFAIATIACSKDRPVVHAPNNLFEADFTLGAETFKWKLSDAAFFKRSLPNDSAITIVAGVGNRHVSIGIHNITTSGSYQFGPYTSTAPQKIIIAQFAKDVSGLSGVYYTSTMDSLSGNISFQLTQGKIVGTFNVTCRRGSDLVIIKNGSFSGAF